MFDPTSQSPSKLYKKWLYRLVTPLLVCSLSTKSVAVFAQTVDNEDSTTFVNQASASYRDVASNNRLYDNSNQLTASTTGLIDPLGQILGCDGNLLPNYGGFSISVYEPDATGLDLGNLVNLSRTEFPDIPDNGISGGKEPNIENSNPFFLTNRDSGQYNFLLDPTAALRSPVNAGLNQTDAGAEYILVLNTPQDSIYSQRRVKLEILATTGNVNNTIIRYRATALDGIPLSTTGGNQVDETIVEVLNAETQGLNLFSLTLGMLMCESDQIDITKTADRAAAQPGDTVVYRLAVRNLVNVDLEAVVSTDTLPVGFQLIPESVTGMIGDQPVTVTTEANGSDVAFFSLTPLPAGQVMTILYAVRVTPDALRGSGENLASVTAERSDNQFFVQDGPSIHRLVIDPGILTDCATLIGRVFVDNNFDGEQQPGEAGIPNAVIFLDDGNRIVTDADGLYSVSCMLPGTRSGVLDFSSLPGYALAPNLYFNERNSQSRRVHLAPGGMVRMNFGVTPTFQEEAQ